MSHTGAQEITVLHVDDEPNFADLVATYLQRANDAFTVVTATSASDGLDLLADGGVDCVVSDFDMPEMDGLEFLEAVRADHPDLPFVPFTGKGSEEIASDAISAGVTEYLQKQAGTDQYTVLANRIEQAVEGYRAKDALEESERMLSMLVSNLPGMAYRCSNEPDWPMEYVSDGCHDLTGYDSEAFVDGDVVWGRDVLLEEDQERLWNAVQTALGDGEAFDVTYRIRTADDEERRVWEQGQGVYEDGTLVAIEGIILHIDSPAVQEAVVAGYPDTTSASTVDGIDDAYVSVDDGRTITDANTAAAALFDTDADSLVGTDIRDAVSSVSEDRLTGRLEHVLSGEGPVRVETPSPSAERWLELTLYPDDDGLSLYASDVTERHEQSTALEQYRTLVENVGDPMYVLDTEGTIQVVNAAMADHLGYEREEIVGSHATAFMSASDVRTGTERIRELLDSDRTWATFEMETIHADGTRTVNEDKIAALTDSQGTFVGSVGVMRDISARKARERELRRYETIIQAVGDPVYTLDTDGQFTFVNEAVEELAGYDPDDLTGQHVTALLNDEEYKQSKEHIGQLLGTDTSYVTFEVELETADGQSIPTENHIALLEDDGEFQGTAGVVRDITERKRREQRLQRFASVVSHDLQSPLNVILGRAELALETGSVDHVENIADAAERMETLIEDLLTLASQGRTVGDPEPTALGNVAIEAWEQVPSPSATLSVEADLTLSADPDRLRELLVNLFRNAVEHGSASSAPRGQQGADRASSVVDAPEGAVEHACTDSRTGSDDTVSVTVETLDGRRGFAVADDGPGVPPDDRGDVFEHGHTTSEEGSGLGLAIVENIAQAHGWSVDVEESAAGGARFVVVTD